MKAKLWVIPAFLVSGFALYQWALPAIQQPSLKSEIEASTMPDALASILAERYRDVPDDHTTRKYIFSLYTGIGHVCGEPSNNMALVAMGYVEPRLAPGQDFAKFGLDMLTKFLVGTANAARSGDIRDLAGVASPEAYLVKEGLTDGANLANRLECGNADFAQFRSGIENLIVKRSGTNFSSR